MVTARTDTHMKTLVRNSFVVLGWAAVSFPALGIGPHVDESLDLAIKGEVSCSSSCTQPVTIKLLGIKFGDPLAEREIARLELGQTGGPFLLTGSVLIGYVGKPTVAPEDRKVEVEFDAKGCSKVKRIISLGDLVRDKYGYFADVGKVTMSCASS